MDRPNPSPEPLSGAEATAPFVEDYLSYLLARASHLVSHEFHARLTEAGLSVPVWRVLAVLYDRDNLVIGVLARMVLLKQPTLSKALDRMIADGLVTRSPSTNDRRRVHVEITAHGRALVEQHIKVAKDLEAEALAEFSATEIATIKTVLRSLIAKLDKKPGDDSE
ncbi:MarR family winged helix-turn-helix transcriptional regulator [Govanella unica]|uniref:MarR family winged helix-turn-helix transcriptional regulator n=1 Tax=Govanella unica TaxID=2975056 RepID=A0A9X3TVD7_9PROT|nr:MarR family winged helix-turn-helix transcriptional regulator [Govania unica]MDA5192460.1 MarR family winged helix-turn-helix transcriptional regulator [Govania unica]